MHVQRHGVRVSQGSLRVYRQLIVNCNEYVSFETTHPASQRKLGVGGVNRPTSRILEVYACPSMELWNSVSMP